MTTSTLGLLLLSVTLSAAAQILFKIGMTSQAKQVGLDQSVWSLFAALLLPGVFGGLLLYGVGTVVWLAVLSRVEVSQAYPFVGLGFALTALLGYAVFGDSLSILRTCGIVMIVGGVILVARS